MLGSQCCSNPPTLNPSSGSGHVETVTGFSSYVTGSPESNRAVILVSDGFGYEAPKFRKLADKVANAGFYVVVPDFFYGEPYDPENKERPVHLWLKDHGVDKGFEDAKLVIEAIKNKGIPVVGAAGFCWGGKVVVQLANAGLIRAAVLLHPSLVSVDDFKDVKAPISILGAENDKYTPPELVKQFEQILAAESKIDAYVKIFPKVIHGWSVRYNVDDEHEVKSAEESHENMLEWFAKYLK